MWTHTGRDGEISTLKSLVTNSPFVSSPAISNSRETRRRIKQSHLKLVTNRSKCPNLLHFSLSHTHTFHRHAEVRSLRVSKAPPNYELLPTIIIIKRGLQPHKSTHNHSQALPHSHHCPTLHSHIHTRTMATPEPRVPLCNPVTQGHKPVLITSERETNDSGSKVEENRWDTKARVQIMWWVCR